MDLGENKKINLEDLSKEELVKKCKGLISLIQKAKVSKDSLQEENNKLKKQINQQGENQTDATYEILDKVTQEKLDLVTQIESLKSKNNTLEDRFKEYQEESKLSQEKLGKLETENISFNRQVKRLTDENEQLLTDLSTLEEQITELNNLGSQQQDQLLQLEKSSETSLRDLQCKLSDRLEEVGKLNGSLKIKEKEIKELRQELQALKIIKNSSVYDSNKNCDIFVKEIDGLKTKNETYSKELLETQNLNEKLKGKVSLYHSKLKKFALTIKEIKEDKNDVLKMFKAYTDQIREWKDQLFTASKKLVELVHNLENENKMLKESKKEDAFYVKQSDGLDKSEIYEEKRDNSLEDIKDKYETETKNIYKELVECKEELNRLKTQFILKENECKEAVSVTEILESENRKLLEDVINYKREIDNFTHELTSKEIVLKKTLDDNEKYIIQNKNFNKMANTYEERITNLNQELASKETVLMQQNTNLNDTFKQSMNTEKLLAEKSSEEIIRLVQSNKELNEENSKLKVKLHQSRNKSEESNFVQAEKDFASSTEEKGIDLKRENSELLLEMNQMNEALKERGEIISKLEAHCEEIRKRLQLYETQANKNVDSITEKEETIKALTKELESLRIENLNLNNQQVAFTDSEIVTGLKTEIGILKEKLNNSIDNSYAESETMSSSTISKCEEANRLKELEGPWEERYGKLRTLAIKLKAKIKEQVIIITELQTEKEELQKKLSNTLKTLQSQIDCLHDELDKVNAEKKTYLSKLNSVAENISKDKQLLVENEETIGKLRKEIENFTTEKHVVENWKKQVSAKVQTLRKELEAKNLLIKDFETKVSKLETDLECKDVQFKNEQENHKQTKSLLDHTNNESKKNSVLNLEMQDYEKSVKDLSQKVEKQKTEINNLQTQFDLQKSTINALREQNKLLEERVQEEEKNGNTISQEISALKKKIGNLEEVLQVKEDKISDITRLMETTRFENEELSTELAKVITEHQKSLNTLKSERDHLRKQISSLQQSLRETQDILKLKGDELLIIKEEYETYKVRAQSVLKKNQVRDLGLEEKLVEELSTLKSQNGELTNAIKELRHKSETNQFAAEEVTKEKDGFKKKCKELEIEIEELKSYSEQLASKYQKAISEHAETVRNLKVHADTLSQCYRQQLSEQEVRHNREIIGLQSRLDKAPSPIDTTPVHPSMPREEGEGSESIESNPPPNNVHPIPLERLLDSKSDNEVTYLKKQLFEQESKLVHLTSILSDTEQDLVKHVQMNKLLKEEIRRQQRSAEREKHAENLEYLKNVVFKFVTLNSGDERTRLVPVLNTILKLSPVETQRLLMVAKGDPGIKGWASYLPMWPSPSKPQ